MSDSPAKRRRIPEVRLPDQPSHTPAPEEGSDVSSNVENISDSIETPSSVTEPNVSDIMEGPSPVTGQSPIPEIEVSFISSSYVVRSEGLPPSHRMPILRSVSSPEFQLLRTKCLEIIRNSRSLSSTMDKFIDEDFVKNFPENLICTLHEKIFNKLVPSSDEEISSGGSSEGVEDQRTEQRTEQQRTKSPDKPKEADVDETPNLIHMVCQEYDKQRKLYLARNRGRTVSEQRMSAASTSREPVASTSQEPVASTSQEPVASTSREPADEELPQCLELTIRLLDWNEAEIRQNKERLAKAKRNIELYEKEPEIVKQRRLHIFGRFLASECERMLEDLKARMEADRARLQYEDNQGYEFRFLEAKMEADRARLEYAGNQGKEGDQGDEGDEMDEGN